MTVATPSTTPVNHQVWPPLPKPAEAPKPAPKPRDEREPVTLDEIQVGDELSFIAAGGWPQRVAERVGRVERVNEVRGRRVIASLATETGVYVLTPDLWDERAPRR